MQPCLSWPPPCGGVFDCDRWEKRLATIEEELAKDGAWNNPEQLTPLLQEKSSLETELNRLKNIDRRCHDLEEWFAAADAESEEEVLLLIAEQLSVLRTLLAELEMSMLLDGEESAFGAILEIHPGAGGVEAQDWAEMLLRMYLRWADANAFKTEFLDFLPGDEAGVKSVILRIDAANGYGLLRGERGVHRLIRISPFDSSGRRHTSFASVDVIPDVGQNINIEIKDSDLRIDAFRASGPGGQKVNKTSSAIRITHIPTGIVVQCQNEKSQHQNKDSAMRVLKSRLYERELRLREAAKKANYADKDAIAWGSQIRTYTLQPYRLVKDHRTGTEASDVDSVLNGNLTTFLKDFLVYRHEQQNQNAQTD